MEVVMSTDSGIPIESSPLFVIDLPKIIRIKISRVRFEPPELEYFQSSLSQYDQAIEFMVETDGVVPIRAYGPALFVGDVEVNHSEYMGGTTWRFLYFETERLQPGASIWWGWMKDPENERLQTQFRYEIEGDTTTSS
jgi:hypothetical protein